MLFSEQDNEIIKKYYPKGGSRACLQPLDYKYNLKQINGKARGLGIKCERPNKGKIPLENFTCFSDASVYTLGFIWGDGYINKSNNQVKFHIKTTDMDDLLLQINQVGEWNIYMYPDQKSVEISCVDQIVHDWFVNYDFLNKSYCEPTKILKEIPDNKHYLFWLGLTDADGSFYFTGKNKFFFEISSTINYKFYEFSKFLTKNNVEYSMRNRVMKRGKTCSFLIRRKESLINFGNSIYRSDFGFKRKRERFNQFYFLQCNQNHVPLAL